MDTSKPLVKFIAIWAFEWRAEATLEAVRAKIPAKVLRSGKYRIYHVDEKATVDEYGSLCFYNRKLIEGMED